MQKNRWAIIYKLLKWGLPSYVALLFLLIGTGSSIAATYGMSSSRFPTDFPYPFDTPTPTAITSPTTTSISIPTFTPIDTPAPIPVLTPDPTVVQTPTPIPTPQLQLTPSGTMFPIQTMVTETPTIATPTSTQTSEIPPVVTNITSKAMAMKPPLTYQQLPHTGESDKILSTFMLPLSIGAPLLLVSGGLFWLLRRRQMNQYKPALLGAFDNTQPTLWMGSRKLSIDFIDTLDLPIQLVEARKSNKYGSVLPSTPPPMVSLDTSISSTPSPSLVPPVVSLPICPPSTKDDPLLGEIMRQTQMGIFVVLGRERA